MPLVKPLKKIGTYREKYLSGLTDVIMVNSVSLLAERLGGADFDGDMIKTVAEPKLTDCILNNYSKGDFSLGGNLPLLSIPSAEPEPDCEWVIIPRTNISAYLGSATYMESYENKIPDGFMEKKPELGGVSAVRIVI